MADRGKMAEMPEMTKLMALNYMCRWLVFEPDMYVHEIALHVYNYMYLNLEHTLHCPFPPKLHVGARTAVWSLSL